MCFFSVAVRFAHLRGGHQRPKRRHRRTSGASAATPMALISRQAVAEFAKSWQYALHAAGLVVSDFIWAYSSLQNSLDPFSAPFQSACPLCLRNARYNSSTCLIATGGFVIFDIVFIFYYRIFSFWSRAACFSMIVYRILVFTDCFFSNWHGGGSVKLAHSLL